MLRIAQMAAALLLLLCLANQVHGWSHQATSHRDDSDVSDEGSVEDNSYDGHEDGHEEYYEGDSEEDGDGEEEGEDYDDLFDLEDEEGGKEEEDRVIMKGTMALRHRARPVRNPREDLHGSRELRSKSSYGRSFSRSFLDPDIEPRPFINCIPVPPDISRSGVGSKSKGKGGNRRNNRRYNSKSRRVLKSSSSSSSRGRARGRSRRTSLSGVGRMGRGGRGRMRKLPYCPLPTFSPTFLPTITPFPTSTPLPTITPFPTFTPFPSLLGGPSIAPSTSPSKGPTTKPSISSKPSATPTLSNAPSRSNQPSKSSSPSATGTTIRTVSWRYSYGFMGTVREPTTEEYNGLYAQTEQYLNDQFRSLYPNTFLSVTPGSASPNYLPNAAVYQSGIDFTAQVTFSSPTNPSSDGQLFTDLENMTNLMNYGTNYVLMATPTTSIYRSTASLAHTAFGTAA